MSVKEINLLRKVNQHKNSIKTSRIKPKILIRHKKIIKQILRTKENDRTYTKASEIQLKLFSENLN